MKTKLSEKQTVVEEKTTGETKSEKKNLCQKRALVYLKKFILSKTALFSTLAVIVLVVGIVLGNSLSSKEKDNVRTVTTISKTSLEKIIEINELSTVDYIYNATTKKLVDESKEDSEVAYYVAYEGVITAGIEFNKIVIKVDETTKKITITVPEVEFQSFKVDMATMEFIFTKDKYETENVTQEAFKLCKADLENRVKKETMLKDKAKESAISAVEALFSPWIATVDNEYQVEVN